MIKDKVVQVMEGKKTISYRALTNNDLDKDINILVYYLAEKLPDHIPFNLAKWEVVEYSDEGILLFSNERSWIIYTDNLQTTEQDLTIHYRFYMVL